MNKLEQEKSQASEMFEAAWQKWIADYHAMAFAHNPDLLRGLAGFFYHQGGIEAIKELREVARIVSCSHSYGGEQKRT